MRDSKENRSKIQGDVIKLSKKKARTLAERFGFQDKELTTPIHDSLFCWLFNKENIIKMLNDLELLDVVDVFTLEKIKYSDTYPQNCDWSYDTHNCTGNCFNGSIELKNSLIYWAEMNFNTAKFKKLQIKNAISIHGEYPILSGTYNIGFVDAKIEIADTIKIDGQEKTRCIFEYKLAPNPDFFIEIKPKVQSLGDLIRQINLYRSHIKNGIWIILTDEIPDIFIDILRSQEIYVYKREDKQSGKA